MVSEDQDGTPVDSSGVVFIMSTAGLGVAILALVLGLGAFLNTRKMLPKES